MGQLAEASSACQVIPYLSPGPPASLCLAAAPGELVDDCPGIVLGWTLSATPHLPLPLLSLFYCFPTSTLAQPMHCLSPGSWC